MSPGPISDSYKGPDGGGDPYFEGFAANGDGHEREENPETDPECRDLWFDGWDEAAKRKERIVSAAVSEKFGAARGALKQVAIQISRDAYIRPSDTISAEKAATHNVGVDRALSIVNQAYKALDHEHLIEKVGDAIGGFDPDKRGTP